MPKRIQTRPEHKPRNSNRPFTFMRQPREGEAFYAAIILAAILGLTHKMESK